MTPKLKTYWEKNTPKHVVFKLLKTRDKDKNLKSHQKGGKAALHEGIKTYMTADTFSGINQVRRQGRDVFEALKGKKKQLFQKQDFFKIEKL